MGIWAILAGLATPAAAQDFDELEDFEFDEPVELPKKDDEEKKSDESEEEKPETAEPPPLDEEDTSILDTDFEDPDDEEIDLLEGDPGTIEGDADTERDYRATLARVEELPPDAGIEEWQSYLEKYPKTIYRSDIEERIDQLFDELYAEGRGNGGEDGPVDALRQEIEFSQGMLLDNINPRSRFQGGLSFGFPITIDATVDYEHAFSRRFSLHGGVRGRYGAFGIELGPRLALVKSAKAQTLVTLSLDFRGNLNPLYPSFRPVLGIGKKFGALQLQVQGGTALDIRDMSDTDANIQRTELQVSYTGGLQIQYAANDRVSVFAESLLLFKPQPRDNAFAGGLFSFNTVAVGLTFYPVIDSKRPESRDLEAKVGGSLPVAAQYYQFYLGSLHTQFNYFTD